MPETVGIRARTSQATSGSVSSSFGRFEPQPPLGTELSTGTPRGAEEEVLLVVVGAPMMGGVCVPGVAGGVNAGDSRDGGGGWACETSPVACLGGGMARSSMCWSASLDAALCWGE